MAIDEMTYEVHQLILLIVTGSTSATEIMARSAANLDFGSRRSSVKAPARKHVGSGSKVGSLGGF